MIWASSPDRALVEHSRWGSYVADMRPLLAVASGNAAALAALAGAKPALVVPDDDAGQAAASRARAAHGALMLAAFALLMPVGALLARHKWLYGDPENQKIQPGWFHLHIRIQMLAIATAVAGVILVFAFFGTDRQRVNKLYTPHLALGVAATAAAVVQAGIGHKRCARGGSCPWLFCLERLDRSARLRGSGRPLGCTAPLSPPSPYLGR
jgi:hypothetical protein